MNNAGILTPGAWLDVTPDMWRDIHNINVLGAVRLIRALVPPMKEASWGRIIQISSAEAAQPGRRPVRLG